MAYRETAAVPREKLTWFGLTALSLVLLGAINWGLIGLFLWNVIHSIFGISRISVVIFALVGLSGLYTIGWYRRIGETTPLTTYDRVAWILVIAGALNWGLYGFFGLDLVVTIFGHLTVITRLIYTLIGVAGVYCVYQLSTLRREERRRMMVEQPVET